MKYARRRRALPPKRENRRKPRCRAGRSQCSYEGRPISEWFVRKRPGDPGPTGFRPKWCRLPGSVKRVLRPLEALVQQGFHAVGGPLHVQVELATLDGGERFQHELRTCLASR